MVVQIQVSSIGGGEPSTAKSCVRHISFVRRQQGSGSPHGASRVCPAEFEKDGVGVCEDSSRQCASK